MKFVVKSLVIMMTVLFGLAVFSGCSNGTTDDPNSGKTVDEKYWGSYKSEYTMSLDNYGKVNNVRTFTKNEYKYQNFTLSDNKLVSERISKAYSEGNIIYTQDESSKKWKQVGKFTDDGKIYYDSMTSTSNPFHKQ